MKDLELKLGLTDEELQLLNQDTTTFESVLISMGSIKAVSNLKEDLTVNENTLVDCMVQHTAKYGWWASINSTAKRMLRKIGREIDKVRSELDSGARTAIKELGVRVTEESVRAWISSDPRAKKNIQEASILEDIVEYTDMVLKAFEHKRDMLKEINKAKCNDKFNER